MKSFVVLATTLLLATVSQAASSNVNDDSTLDKAAISPLAYLGAFAAPTMPQSCTDAAFTDDQKTAMRNEVYAAERRAVTLKANMKVAGMDYHHTISNNASAIADATTAEAALVGAIGALMSNKIDLLNTLLYTVLTPDQRANAISCFMEIEKMAMEKKLAKICAKMPKP